MHWALSVPRWAPNPSDQWGEKCGGKEKKEVVWTGKALYLESKFGLEAKCVRITVGRQEQRIA